MKKLFGRLIHSGRQVATWYTSPMGVISAVALLLALGFSAAGSVGAAVWILAVWLGTLLPYKLTRERQDRLQQVSSVSRQISAVSQQVAAVSERLNRVETDLAATPTVEELSEWQDSLDRQSATLQAKFASLDQLRESVRLRRESMQTRDDQTKP